jgi:hypothetical protein
LAQICTGLGGVDALTVCRRIGHASPAVTTKVYAHLFSETDKTAAKAIEAALRTGKEQWFRIPAAIRDLSRRRAKRLIHNDGTVAEWLKAALKPFVAVPIRFVLCREVLIHQGFSLMSISAVPAYIRPCYRIGQQNGSKLFAGRSQGRLVELGLTVKK